MSQSKKKKKVISLVIKHLPPDLPENKVIELFTHYGATSVRWMHKHSKLRGFAFLECSSQQAADTIIHKFHNLKFKDRLLSVEYARTQIPKNQEEIEQLVVNEEKKCVISEKLGFRYESNPNLYYKYPPANSQIVSNIAKALLAVPKFYTQVLHLMNKMNLPPPFAGNFPQIPLSKQQEDVLKESMETMNQKVTHEKRKREDSIESIDEDRKKKLKTEVVRIITDAEQPVIEKKIETPQLKINLTEQPATETYYGPKKFNVLTDYELKQGKLPQEELVKLKPALSKYTPGNPNKKLFVHNLPGTVKKEDLEYIFGRYFKDEETMRRDLEIKVMDGRMRGKAFITFPTVELATKAIQELHGFKLKDRPMIIYYGKS